ncbi:MAG: DUF1080 domain-containing protein [Planctomycetota bacterium]|nr:DUF1080 domain-containing protein [Planctomycetota bacterium]
MLIIYCDKCGKRIPERQIEASRAQASEEGYLCLECAKQSPRQASSKSRIAIPRRTPAGITRQHFSPDQAAPGAPSPYGTQAGRAAAWAPDASGGPGGGQAKSESGRRGSRGRHLASVAIAAIVALGTAGALMFAIGPGGGPGDDGGRKTASAKVETGRESKSGVQPTRKETDTEGTEKSGEASDREREARTRLAAALSSSYASSEDRIKALKSVTAAFPGTGAAAEAEREVERESVTAARPVRPAGPGESPPSAPNPGSRPPVEPSARPQPPLLLPDAAAAEVILLQEKFESATLPEGASPIGGLEWKVSDGRLTALNAKGDVETGRFYWERAFGFDSPLLFRVRVVSRNTHPGVSVGIMAGERLAKVSHRLVPGLLLQFSGRKATLYSMGEKGGPVELASFAMETPEAADGMTMELVLDGKRFAAGVGGRVKASGEHGLKLAGGTPLRFAVSARSPRNPKRPEIAAFDDVEVLQLDKFPGTTGVTEDGVSASSPRQVPDRPAAVQIGMFDAMVELLKAAIPHIGAGDFAAARDKIGRLKEKWAEQEEGLEALERFRKLLDRAGAGYKAIADFAAANAGKRLIVALRGGDRKVGDLAGVHGGAIELGGGAGGALRIRLADLEVRSLSEISGAAPAAERDAALFSLLLLSGYDREALASELEKSAAEAALKDEMREWGEALTAAAGALAAVAALAEMDADIASGRWDAAVKKGENLLAEVAKRPELAAKKTEITEKLGEARAHASGLAGLFAGKVRDYGDGRVSFEYDFRDPSQLDDFAVSQPLKIENDRMVLPGGCRIAFSAGLRGDASVRARLAPAAGIVPQDIALRLYRDWTVYSGYRNTKAVLIRCPGGEPRERKEVPASLNPGKEVEIELSRLGSRTAARANGAELMAIETQPYPASGRVVLSVGTPCELRWARLEGFLPPEEIKARKEYIAARKRFESRPGAPASSMDLLAGGIAGWRTGGTISIRGGTLDVEHGSARPTGVELSDFALRFEVRRAAGDGHAFCTFRELDSRGYEFSITGSRAVLKRADWNHWSSAAREKEIAARECDGSKWRSVSIVASGRKVTISIDGSRFAEFEDGEFLHQKGLCFGAHSAKVEFRGIRISAPPGR